MFAALALESWESVMRVVSLLPASGRPYSSAPEAACRIEWRRLPTAVFGRTVAMLRECRQRSRERAQLAALDERMLRDIGISRGDVLREINKPFWRV